MKSALGLRFGTCVEPAIFGTSRLRAVRVVSPSFLAPVVRCCLDLSDALTGVDGVCRGFRVLAFALALSATSSVVHGQEADVVVDQFSVWSNVNDSGAVRIIPLGAAVVNPGGACADADSYFTHSRMSATVQARVLAVALSAKLSGRRLGIRISGCSELRPAIVAAWIL